MVSLGGADNRPLKSVLDIALLLVVVLNSGYMLMVTTGSAGSVISAVSVFCGLLSLNGLVLHVRRFGMDGVKTRINLIAVVIVLAFATCFTNGENPIAYCHFLSLLIIGCFISVRCSFQDFIAAVGSCLCLITVVSFLFLLIIQMSGVPSPLSVVNTSVSVVDYYNYLVFFYPRLVVEGLARNQAIFWEPGLYAGFLLMALCLEIVFRDRPSKWKMLIMSLGVASSFSSAGIIMLPLIAIMGIERQFSDSKGKTIAELALILLAVAVVLNSEEIIDGLIAFSPSVFGKLSGSEVTKLTRIVAPIVNMDIFAHAPIFGAGLHGATNAFLGVKDSYGIDSQTSTCTFLVAAYGIMGIGLNLVLFISILKIDAVSVSQRVLVAILLAVLLNAEPYQELAFLWLLFFCLVGESSLEPRRSDSRFRSRAGLR